MSTYSIMGRAFLAASLLAAPMLAGCNTTAGFGRDVSATGRFIEGGAQTTHDWMFGAPAQAAEAPVAPEATAIPAAGANVVYFSTGSAELRGDALDMIRGIAADVAEGAARVEVTGYSDTAGPAEYNERLSQRRADAVAAELAAQGVPRERIAVNWHGETQPAVPTGDGVSEAQNRRASIALSSG